MNLRWLAVCWMVWCCAAVVQGQTALERIEDFVRQRVNQANPPNLPTDTPPPNPTDVPTEQPLPALPAQPNQSPGYLGAVLDDREENGRGVRVMEVIEDGPAQKSGLKDKDLVIGVAGKPVRTIEDLKPLVGAAFAGTRLMFDVERDGLRVQVPVTLGTRPDPNQRRFGNFGRITENAPVNPATPTAEPNLVPAMPAPRGALLGVRTIGVTPDAQLQLRLPSMLGALVSDVLPDSPAALAGVLPHDCIVAVNDQVVNRPSDLSDLVTQAGPGRLVEISYYRLGRFASAKVQLGETSTLKPAVEDVPNPQPQNQPDDLSRVEQLERAVGDLQQRVQQLEAELRRLRGAEPK